MKRTDRLIHFSVALLVVVLVAIIYATSARAASNEDLVVQCSQRSDAAQQSFCFGYLLGVWDGVVTVSVRAGKPAVCVGDAPPSGIALRDLYIDWIEKHRATEKSIFAGNATDTIIDAMTAAHPCAK